MRDLSEFHHPITGLFERPKDKKEWEKFRLSDEQVTFFHDQGYLAGIRILDDNQIDALRAELAALTAKSHEGNDLFYEFHSNESQNSDTVLFHALGAWRIEPSFHDVLWDPAFSLCPHPSCWGAR